MRYDEPIYLSSPTVILGERVETSSDAVAGGRTTPETAERYGYRALPVSDLAPVELSEQAAVACLARAGLPAGKLDRLLHAWTYYQGHEFWSPAHYLAARLGADRAVPLGIQQMCNGAMAAIDIGATMLIADPIIQWGLVTTGDRFADVGFDRWGDLGVAYGDGATAVLVSRSPCGPAVRLLASATAAASELEGMHRGSAPFALAPGGAGLPIRPEQAKRQFRAVRPDADFGKVAREVVEELIGTVLSQADLRQDDPSVVAMMMPRLAENILADVYRPAASAACSAPIPDLGRDSGHLGAGDPVANLADFLRTGADRLHIGQHIVLLGAGAGFTWSAAVVEVSG